MKHIYTLTLSIISFLFLANFGTGREESSIEGRDAKQRINFKGELTTYEGNKFKVENISFERTVKQIKMLEKPQEKSYSKDSSDPNNIILNVDPKNLTTIRIDLAEVREISAPNPAITWTYQKNSKGRKYKYIELTVVSNDNTKNNYLTEHEKKLYVDAKKAAGPVEMDVPLPAVMLLKIEGYSLREEEKKKGNQPLPAQSSHIVKVED